MIHTNGIRCVDFVAAHVSKYFPDADESQELSQMSNGSASTMIDLAQPDEDIHTSPSFNIPATVTHRPPEHSTDPIWTVIHKLDQPVEYKRKTFTHICLICAKSKDWRRCLCKTAHASNAKSHLVRNHNGHELAVREEQHRVQRAQRFIVDGSSKRDISVMETSQAEEEPRKATKRQKKTPEDMVGA
ncbi:unnamed protein product [Phytophthora fragariaefolia]|uniref:Unnamed protein product n=1 Tax=Phytophthora fragariaefolia TaxID=1490495 RepID=A0A9W6UCK6_9STRA|nr:unnamed protein product [Phytophthora fragariaefolia]